MSKISNLGVIETLEGLNKKDLDKESTVKPWLDQNRISGEYIDFEITGNNKWF